jgi:hypothetical protein
MGDHPLCRAESERLAARFDADVVAGKYDARGFTPNDRRRQQKRNPAGVLAQGSLFAVGD